MGLIELVFTSGKKTSLRVGDRIDFRLNHGNLGFSRDGESLLIGDKENDRFTIGVHTRSGAVRMALLIGLFSELGIKLIKENDNVVVFEFVKIHLRRSK